MASPVRTRPVEDSVPKVNDDLAVGEDLRFQRRWWRFEKVVWIVFAIIIVLDLLGAFGRGPLAKARMRTADGAMDVRYERIERLGTPSNMRIAFGPEAIRDGKIKLWVSQSTVRELGTQRVVPQPLTSVVGEGGIEYTFSATTPPASVAFALQPAAAGMHHMSLRVEGSPQLNARIFVMP